MVNSWLFTVEIPRMYTVLQLHCTAGGSASRSADTITCRVVYRSDSEWQESRHLCSYQQYLTPITGHHSFHPRCAPAARWRTSFGIEQPPVAIPLYLEQIRFRCELGQRQVVG